MVLDSIFFIFAADIVGGSVGGIGISTFHMRRTEPHEKVITSMSKESIILLGGGTGTAGGSTPRSLLATWHAAGLQQRENWGACFHDISKMFGAARWQALYLLDHTRAVYRAPAVRSDAEAKYIAVFLEAEALRPCGKGGSFKRRGSKGE